MSPEELLAQARSGNQRALARLATLIENDPAAATTVRAALQGSAANARIAGITGPPGAGKSTLLASVARFLVESGHTVAIIAVDPTSPLTGGATLGDRIRMSEVTLQPGVFMRSLASRTRQDGLAPAALDMIRLFEGTGFDYVFLETVGAGQNQVEIASCVHTLVLVEAPGAGDSVQMLKAGIMELADIYAVTKSDLPGAHLVSHELRSMLTLTERGNGDWKPPVVLCSNETGDGIAALVQAIDDHADYLKSTGRIEERQQMMARSEISGALLRLADRWLDDPDRASALLHEVTERATTPESAARTIAAEIADRVPAGEATD